MFVLGHIGIGRVLARPFLSKAWRDLPRTAAWLALGTMLPDLIDKPLYYANQWLAWGLDWCTCSRTVGHTGVLTLGILFFGWVLRKRSGVLIALGIATHLLLDALGDRLSLVPGTLSSTALAVVYPFGPGHFGEMPFDSLADHAGSILHPWTLGSEVLGALVLLRDRQRLRHREIR